MTDDIIHVCQPEADERFWRAVCSCGYRSKLCRSKAAARRASAYHLEHREPTVSTRRSRLPPGLRLPTGAKRPGRYDSTAEACLDAKDRDAPKPHR